MFSPTTQYAVCELGIAYIAPNVRGSSGYGKSYMKLDNGKKREDSVRDIGALLDWIGKQPELDASRVGVFGGSYGGVGGGAGRRRAAAADDFPEGGTPGRPAGLLVCRVPGRAGVRPAREPGVGWAGVRLPEDGKGGGADRGGWPWEGRDVRRGVDRPAAVGRVG